ncbi:unnamed protein product [Adineta ricciae]|uniref:Uncharacterized protein n=1 Tax=Adineta ricciae TaxID=249248 RepID=A0A814NS60_ADIRI|nr:unnamed protein product [Adineta ricciae]
MNFINNQPSRSRISSDITLLQLNSNSFTQFPQTNTMSTSTTHTNNVLESERLVYTNNATSKSMEVEDHRSTHILCTETNMSHNPSQISNDYICLTNLNSETGLMQSTKIQIKHQPRAKFRPRTQNESKTSAHYIRCEGSVGAEYPTIFVPQIWARESDTNIIEIQLVDILKNPHPYSLNNKTSADQSLDIQSDEPNKVFFRLTNDDFVNGSKSLMIEFIKSKQDNYITKKLIQERKLYQSMLRFTRIFRNKCGQYHYDVGSTEYSNIMTESYGNISIEHIGPKYGPMTGGEIIFIILKGRVMKSDVSIELCEQVTHMLYKIDKFVVQSNVIYFRMPSCSISDRTHVQISIVIYYKKEKFYETIYHYMASLNGLSSSSNTDDFNSDSSLSFISNCSTTEPIDEVLPTSRTPPKASKSKAQKRLDNR